jgi:hypothetical protein
MTKVARPSRRERRTKKGVQPKTLRYSSDADADWYHRDKQEGPDRDPEAKLSIWGYYACLVVSGSDDPEQHSTTPTLVMGMAPLRKLSTRPGESAVVALTSIGSRGHPAHYLAGDRAYTQCKPEHFQLPARALGYKVVLDHKKDQLGRQCSFAGMLLVDGSWYSPGMPESLIDTTLEFQKGLIDEATWATRIEERRSYQMRPKANPDAASTTDLSGGGPCTEGSLCAEAQVRRRRRTGPSAHSRDRRVEPAHTEGLPPAIRDPSAKRGSQVRPGTASWLPRVARHIRHPAQLH